MIPVLVVVVPVAAAIVSCRVRPLDGPNNPLTLDVRRAPVLIMGLGKIEAAVPARIVEITPASAYAGLRRGKGPRSDISGVGSQSINRF